jgi:hypothetical protein
MPEVSSAFAEGRLYSSRRWRFHSYGIAHHREEGHQMRIFRAARAAIMAVVLAASCLPIILSATPANACVLDGDNDCYRHVTGTVEATAGLNVRTQPWGTIIDTLPYLYSSNVDCYVQASDGSYWDWIYDSRIGRSGWVYDPYLYTGGNINQQVDEMHEGNCAYFSLSPPVDVYAYPLSTHQVEVTWYDQTGGQAQYLVTNGNSYSSLLPMGTTSTTWNINPGQYMCFAVAAYEGGSYSAWSPYYCLTAPIYDIPDSWFGSTSTSGSPETDPINMILSSASTVSLGQLYNALNALQGDRYTDPLGVTIYAQWTRVYSPVGNLTQGYCLNTVYADISGSWRPEDFAAREFGCDPITFDPLAGPWDHFRAWNYDGVSYIAASTEHVCLSGHCPVSFNDGRDWLLNDIYEAVAAQGWAVSVQSVHEYGGNSISSAPYDGNVDVITIT